MKTENKVEVFDPAMFGFETYKVSRVRKYKDGDYIRISQPNKPNTKEKMYLSLCEDTYRFVHDLYESDDICLAVNDKGIILLYDNPENQHLHMSKLSPTGSCRRTISINALQEKFESIFGKFSLLPLEVSIYANGNAIMLKPKPDRIIK